MSIESTNPFEVNESKLIIEVDEVKENDSPK